jgi:hypothetical protein
MDSSDQAATSAGLHTASSVVGERELRGRVADWLFLEGDRRILATGLIVAVVGLVGSLVSVGVVAVGADSSVAGVFGSGLTAGVVTLLTIALSINQLILSRLFGSLHQLTDRMDGSRDLRGRVAELAGQHSSANDPAAFLCLVTTTVSDRATTALSIIERTDADPPVALTRALEEIAAYGRSIDAQVEPGTAIVSVLGVIVGPEYAINMTAVRHLRNEYAESLPANARTELRALDELLEFVGVVRQFFKTIALQQDLAALSRLLIYSGLIALLVSVSMTLVYQTDSATLSPSTLRIVVPVALGVVIAPFALFAAYILRAATIAYRTISVGPFIPPEDR